MAKTPNTVSLTIMEREYRINCPEGAESELREAASYLDDKMQEIREASSKAGKVLGADRIAVIAALNITHQLREAQSGQIQTDVDIGRLNKRLDALLEEDSQLEL
ncbi:cell division protein ZapA [Thalassolituus maritimus]|uniref:Cell division protein ZapA n=1 Tax=Thalassolituus maritimus TaxID=484498 RepID=A0ABP9ZXY5_9GAMM